MHTARAQLSTQQKPLFTYPPHRQSLGVPCLQDTRYQSEHDCSLNMLCIVLIAQTGTFQTQSEQQFTAESICRGRLARRDLILQTGCTAHVLSAVNVTDQQCQHAMTLKCSLTCCHFATSWLPALCSACAPLYPILSHTSSQCVFQAGQLMYSTHRKYNMQILMQSNSAKPYATVVT